MAEEFFCNPINVPYRYQFNKDPRQKGKIQICREAADPSMILFKGKYYIFASMNLSVWVSEDLVSWKEKRLPENLPLYDYAPDACVIGDYVYLCASRRGRNLSKIFGELFMLILLQLCSVVGVCELFEQL